MSYGDGTSFQKVIQRAGDVLDQTLDPGLQSEWPYHHATKPSKAEIIHPGQSVC